MINLSHYFLVIPLCIFLFSCGDSDIKDDFSKIKNNLAELTEDDLYEFEAFSLAPYDINATIYLPDETASIGSSTEPEIEHEEDGFKWFLSIGNNFKIRIDDWGKQDMIQEKRNQLEDDKKFYTIEFLEDTEKFIRYEKKLKVKGIDGISENVGIDHTSYHCYGQINIDGINYVFSSLAEGNTKPISEYISTSIKSVEALNLKVSS